MGALILGGLAGVGGAAGYEAVTGDDTSAPRSDQIDTSELDPLDLVSVNSVAKKVLPSVVKITAMLPDGSGFYGSGSVLTSDGEILTNNHVVEPADTNNGTLTVSFSDGSLAEAELVGRDPATDVALIKVVDGSDLPVIDIADSDQAEVGQAVVAVGSPYGLDATVTAGIISALHRPVIMPLESDPSKSSVYGAIQTDAPINPGNSGGALVNMAGQLVGVNSSLRPAEGSDPLLPGDLGNIGIGYAIPINDAMPIVEQLRAGEDPVHADLGVSGQDAEYSPGVPGGAEITSLQSDSVAGAAGLEDGDVITGIGEIHVGSWDGLQAAIYSFQPDEETEITYVRDGESQTVPITMGSDGG